MQIHHRRLLAQHQRQVFPFSALKLRTRSRKNRDVDVAVACQELVHLQVKRRFNRLLRRLRSSYRAVMTMTGDTRQDRRFRSVERMMSVHARVRGRWFLSLLTMTTSARRRATRRKDLRFRSHFQRSHLRNHNVQARVMHPLAERPPPWARRRMVESLHRLSAAVQVVMDVANGSRAKWCMH